MALLVLLAVPVSSASAAPSPAPADFLGSNIQNLVRGIFIPATNWPTFLNQGTQAGLGVTRFDASWALAEPVRPGADGVHHYNWAFLDKVATALANANQRWLPVVDLPPAWAQTAGDVLPPAQWPAFDAFAAAFAQRYGATGAFWAANPGLNHIPITQVEVWTEANSTHFWTGDADATKYMAVFEQVRAAMRAVDPSLQVLVSIGWQSFQDYMPKLYAAGLAGNSDGIGFHPYAPTPAGIILLTREMTQITAAHGEPDLPIYMTEIGQPDAPPGTVPSPTAYTGAVSDSSRAASASIAADALANSDCNLKGYDWYSLVEPQQDPNNVEDWLGLVNVNGTPTQTLQALAGSAQRWAGPAGAAVRASKTKLMPLCHGADAATVIRSSFMPPNGLLPLQLHIPVPVTGPCPTLAADYYNYPLEDVSIFIRNYKNREKGAVTKANGLGQICLGTGAPKRPFLAWARSGSFASSPVYKCTGKSCTTISCRKLKITAKPGVVKSGILPFKFGVKCGKVVMPSEAFRITGISANGHKHVLKSLYSGTKTTVLKLPAKAAWKLRKVRIKFAGDSAFLLPAVTRTLRLSTLKQAESSRRS